MGMGIFGAIQERVGKFLLPDNKTGLSPADLRAMFDAQQAEPGYVPANVFWMLDGQQITIQEVQIALDQGLGTSLSCALNTPGEVQVYRPDSPPIQGVNIFDQALRQKLMRLQIDQLLAQTLALGDPERYSPLAIPDSAFDTTDRTGQTMNLGDYWDKNQ